MYLSFGHDALFLTRQNDATTSLQISYADLATREVRRVLSDRMLRFNTVIGLKRMREHGVLVVASEAEQKTTIGLSPIFEVRRVGWVAVAPEEQQEAVLGEVGDLIGEAETVFADGLHYYSPLYDLSLPYALNKLRSPDAAARDYYDQFVWNLNLARMDGLDRHHARLFEKYCPRLVQGYLQEFVTALPHSERIRYILISRRSTRKAGTRFYARGVDDEGNVANFTETEQIAEMGGLVFTHLQLRGSVPAFFAQTGVNGLAGELAVERTLPLTLPAFSRHFDRLAHRYRRLLALNLLSDAKPDERLLSNFYEALVEATRARMPYLRYQFYDFHEECRNNQFENSEALVRRLSEVADLFAFTCYDLAAEQFLTEQTGAFRTNCLDCLDRTNYLQSRLALAAFRSFLLRFAGSATAELVRAGRLLDQPVNAEYPLLGGFNALWADNGDAISLLYTGIASTHTDITRTGERTLSGAVSHKLRSLMRFYTQFTDHTKQSGINTLLTPTPDHDHDHDHTHDSHPTSIAFHTTFTISFQTDSDESDVLDDIDCSLRKERPTLIVYFLYANRQASWLDKLRCYFKSDGPELKAWRASMTAFSEEKNYVMVGELQSQASWLGVFCMKEATHRISDVRKEDLSTAVTAGEALLIKMKLENSSFIFAGLNCPTLQHYLKVFDEIHEKGFQTSKLGLFKSASLFDLDYRVVVGNTGSRLLMGEGELERLKGELHSLRERREEGRASKVLGKILDHDEMNLEELRYRNKYIRQYSEAPLDFIPSANRLLFWNQEGVILRVRDYATVGVSGLRAVLDYEVGRAYRHP